jgi:tocopherol O-methyltransferase
MLWPKLGHGHPIWLMMASSCSCSSSKPDKLIMELQLQRGEHIHHGYWATDESKAKDSKEVAQISLIRLLLNISGVAEGSRVLDVGCGIGGTSRYLASQLGCSVTGITISGKQVEIATRLTKAEAKKESGSEIAEDADGFVKLGKGKVKFIELDAEKMGNLFAGPAGGFDVVWISEALSHFPNKALFFQNAHKVLKEGGKLVLADWFKAEELGQKEFDSDIKPIEGLHSPSPGLRVRRGADVKLPTSRWHAVASALHPA